jgi:hypothetical protein
MVVAPLPVVALLIFVECFVVAVLLVTAIPVRAIDDDFVVVLAVIIVMILVVVTDFSAPEARHGKQSGGREGQQRGAVLQRWHTVILLISS